MRKIYLLIFLGLLCSVTGTRAQQTEKKYYNTKVMAGDACLRASYGEYANGVSSKVFIVDVTRPGKYYFSSLATMSRSESYKVFVDESPLESISAGKQGWQIASATNAINLKEGKHYVRIEGVNPMVPMVEEILLTTADPSSRALVPEAMTTFLNNVEIMKQQPLVSSQEQQEQASLTSNKVLPNPLGLYGHAIDTAFTYSHFSTIWLTPGTYTFTT
ncbi:MAG TPA: hypothetical protein VGO58_09105, partial [Chitinophagaceae bacterium]|nr:hypothetical protein [Chitinophagaceae bacterium]